MSLSIEKNIFLSYSENEGRMITMRSKCNEIMREIAKNGEPIATQYLEMGIDSFLDNNEILKEIPVVKTVVAVIKTQRSLSEANYMKKLINFCYNMEDIPSMERIKYVNKAISDDENFGEKLLLTLEKIDDLDKTQMLVKLFRAYGNKDGIDYHTFRRLCLALEKTYVQDLLFGVDVIAIQNLTITSFSKKGMIVSGNILPNKYIPYYKKLNDAIKVSESNIEDGMELNKYIDLEKISGEIESGLFNETLNLIDSSSFVRGTLSTSGVVVESSDSTMNYIYTIKIPDGTFIGMNAVPQIICFYDESMEFLESKQFADISDDTISVNIRL